MQLIDRIRAYLPDLSDSALQRILGICRSDTIGRPHKGDPPFGWRCFDGQLIPVSGEQLTIARAKQLRADGLSYARIGRRLLAEDYLPRKVGAIWHATSVKRMIDRE